ncbi:hypothetical protein [Flagellimonas sp.]|uniref:hypothetical protein n=1 Tax=Flagellimonas sp. TaxID=2058762 RepID=UPI003F4A6718
MTHKAKQNIYQGVVIALLSFIAVGLFGFGIQVYDAVKNLTFDSPEQKERMKIRLDVPPPVGAAEREKIIMHIEDEDIHMDFEEKATIIRIEENQKRIGQDLQEIKNLLRQ